jgi:signal transduction histidine kinase/DNA-binding response OmpR family regulator
MINKSVLYSIALSIGSSENFKKSIEIFVTSLVKNQIAPQANFWIQKASILPSLDGIAGHAELYASYPELEKKASSFNANRLFDKLSDKGFIAEPTSELFPIIDQQTKTKHFLLSLGNAGFIELIFDKSTKGVFGLGSLFDKNDYNELSPVLDKFMNQLRRDAAIYERTLQREKSRESRSALGNLLIRKNFQRRIVATLSHEFRNPLNIIMGYLDLLSETKLSKEQKEYLEIVTDTSQSLYYTVKKVFQFTNLTLDQSVFDTESFNLFQLFNRIEKIMAYMGTKKKISLRFDIDQKLNNWLLGDESKLSDILICLIDNAFKFTSLGEIVVRTKLLSDTPTHVAIQFEVTDTGIGIDSVHHEQIFRFFGQEDDSITRNYGGLGLGLSIANEYVRRMGGTLDLRSEKGKGTSVIFDISFEKDLHWYGSIRQSVTKINKDQTRSIKVLLVDDDAYQRDMGVKILKDWDLHIAENGWEAIKFLEQNTDTQVILMDIRMPILDGISATRIIRKELNSKALVIAVSGEVQDTTIEECMAAGMDCFVPKPYDKEHLIQLIVGKLKQPDLVLKVEQDPNINRKLVGLKALVVEDNDMIQLLIARHMKDAGCSYIITSDGKSALELFEKGNFDFVLLDLYLPDIDGFELVSLMHSTGKDACFIAYSGDDSADTRKAIENARMDGMILKNHRKSDELALNINHLIERKKSRIADSKEESGSTYNLDSVRNIIGDSEEDLIDILQSFVNYSNQMITSLESCRISNDQDGIKRIAHTLKSSAKQFLMNETANKLDKLENEIANLDSDFVNSLISDVISEFTIALEDMKGKYKI